MITVYEACQKEMEKEKAKAKEHYDAHHINLSFEVKDKVYLTHTIL